MKEALRIVALAMAAVCMICVIRMRLKVDEERKESGEKGFEAWARYHRSLGRRPLHWFLMVLAVLCLFFVWYLGGLTP